MKFVSLVALTLILAGCSSSGSTVTAPAQFKVKFDTSKGPFIIEVHRDAAPKGADRFYELVKMNFFDEARFFRVMPGFVVQWGIPKDPKVAAEWREKSIEDDPVTQSNLSGTITFANHGKESRTTQLFINLVDNPKLDSMLFAPFGKVVEGMEVVQSIYSGYGQTPDQRQIQKRGNEYLESAFPKLDYIKSTTIL